MNRIRFNKTHESVKIIAYEVNGVNMIFNSINECCEYFRGIGQNYIYPETIARRCVDGSCWGYSETYFIDGVKHTEHHEFFFDELADGDMTTAINTGVVPTRHNRPTPRKNKESNGQNQLPL